MIWPTFRPWSHLMTAGPITKAMSMAVTAAPAARNVM